MQNVLRTIAIEKSRDSHAILMSSSCVCIVSYTGFLARMLQRVTHVRCVQCSVLRGAKCSFTHVDTRHVIKHIYEYAITLHLHIFHHMSIYFHSFPRPVSLTSRLLRRHRQRSRYRPRLGVHIERRVQASTAQHWIKNEEKKYEKLRWKKIW